MLTSFYALKCVSMEFMEVIMSLGIIKHKFQIEFFNKNKMKRAAHTTHIHRRRRERKEKTQIMS